MSPWLQAMCLPKRWRVAGVRLGVLNVWHHFALSQLGNMALYDSPHSSADDAACLIAVCSRPLWVGRLMLTHDRFCGRVMVGAIKAVEKYGRADAIAECREYAKACTRRPAHFSGGDKAGTPVAAPHEMHLVSVLCSAFGMTHAEAWACPYALARCLYDVHNEANGDKTLYGQLHEAAKARLEARQAAQKAGV